MLFSIRDECTFVWCHHFAADELLESIIAFDVESECFHEAVFGLVAPVEFEHEDTTEVTHRRLDLVHSQR